MRGDDEQTSTPEPHTGEVALAAAKMFGPDSAAPATPAIDVKSLHAKIGQLTLENDFKKRHQLSMSKGSRTNPNALAMQILDHSRAVSCLVVRRAGVDVFHSVTHGAVEQDGDLARRGSYCLGIADACRKPPVECALRRVGPSNGYGSKPQKRRGPTSQSGVFVTRAPFRRRSGCGVNIARR